MTPEPTMNDSNRAFPESDLARARRMRDESSPGTASFVLWNAEYKRLSSSEERSNG